MAANQVYRFYAELDGYAPKIWRRFEMTGRKTIAELGYILMTMFEMQGSHLFRFTYDHGAGIIEGMRKRSSDSEVDKMLIRKEISVQSDIWCFELPSHDLYKGQSGNEKRYDADEYRLSEIAGELPEEVIFEYDYSDEWRVKLTLESCEKAEIAASELPRVLEGEGFGIIEDCGGVAGLMRNAKTYKKKEGRQEEYRESFGVDAPDLSAFDMADMNYRLKKLPKIYKRKYEEGIVPAKRSMYFIERRYKE